MLICCFLIRYVVGLLQYCNGGDLADYLQGQMRHFLCILLSILYFENLQKLQRPYRCLFLDGFNLLVSLLAAVWMIVLYADLRNRRCGGVNFLQIFFVFLFFPSTKKYETTVLGNGWTDFHETFIKWYRGKWSLKRRVAAWWKSCRRLANGECWDLRNLCYDSGGISTAVAL